jgi:hypothetical protein
MYPPISRASLDVQFSTPGNSAVESGHSTSTIGESPSICRTEMMTSPDVPSSGSDRKAAVVGP